MHDFSFSLCLDHLPWLNHYWWQLWLSMTAMMTTMTMTNKKHQKWQFISGHHNIVPQSSKAGWLQHCHICTQLKQWQALLCSGLSWIAAVNWHQQQGLQQSAVEVLPALKTNTVRGTATEKLIIFKVSLKLWWWWWWQQQDEEHSKQLATVATAAWFFY